MPFFYFRDGQAQTVVIYSWYVELLVVLLKIISRLLHKVTKSEQHLGFLKFDKFDFRSMEVAFIKFAPQSLLPGNDIGRAKRTRVDITGDGDIEMADC